MLKRKRTIESITGAIDEAIAKAQSLAADIKSGREEAYETGSYDSVLMNTLKLISAADDILKQSEAMLKEANRVQNSLRYTLRYEEGKSVRIRKRKPKSRRRVSATTRSA